MEQGKNLNQPIKQKQSPLNPLEAPSLKPEAALQDQGTKTSDCKYCKFPVKDNFYFCPNCGKKIKELPFKFSIVGFIGNLLLSIILPPLGIYPGIKHLKNPNKTAKFLGILYIVLTILITIIMVKFMIDYVNNINKTFNNLYLQQNLYF